MPFIKTQKKRLIQNERQGSTNEKINEKEVKKYWEQFTALNFHILRRESEIFVMVS